MFEFAALLDQDCLKPFFFALERFDWGIEGYKPLGEIRLHHVVIKLSHYCWQGEIPGILLDMGDDGSCIRDSYTVVVQDSCCGVWFVWDNWG
jgi:hypothetical protein